MKFSGSTLFPQITADRPNGKSFDEYLAVYQGFALMKFRVPGFPNKYEYDDQETEEYRYPPTGLIYSAAGVLKPFVIVNHTWKKHTLLHEVILPKQGIQRTDNEETKASPEVIKSKKPASDLEKLVEDIDLKSTGFIGLSVIEPLVQEAVNDIPTIGSLIQEIQNNRHLSYNFKEKTIKQITN